MTKLIKILALLTLLIFITGCEDKPMGEKVVFKSTKDMDPRLKAYPEAVEWYENSDMDKVSVYNLGVLYQNKIIDYKQAIIWYKKALDMGYRKASFGLGNSYRNLKDYQNAIKWYLKDDSTDSLFNIGFLYNNELKDYQNAIKYYKLAIERESLQAIKAIAWLYYEDLKDDIKASAYMLTLIKYGETKDVIFSFLKEKWNLSDETIKKGYELQLTMPGLPRRYKGGI